MKSYVQRYFLSRTSKYKILKNYDYVYTQNVFSEGKYKNILLNFNYN